MRTGRIEKRVGGIQADFLLTLCVCVDPRALICFVVPRFRCRLEIVLPRVGIASDTYVFDLWSLVCRFVNASGKIGPSDCSLLRILSTPCWCVWKPWDLMLLTLVTFLVLGVAPPPVFLLRCVLPPGASIPLPTECHPPVHLGRSSCPCVSHLCPAWGAAISCEAAPASWRQPDGLPGLTTSPGSATLVLK